MSAVTRTISFTAGFVKQMIKDLFSSTFSITAASGNFVLRIVNGVLCFFGSIAFGSFDLVKAFIDGILNNLMLMVLVTSAFFMYTMYLQRQRELQNPSATTTTSSKLRASRKTAAAGMKPLTSAPQFHPQTAPLYPTATQFQQPQAAYNFTTAAASQPSVFGGAAQEAMRRVPVQAQQQTFEQQQQYQRMMQPAAGQGMSAVY